MRLDQFTVKAQDAITSAQTDAEKRDHPEVTPAHLLLAMSGQEGTAFLPVIQKAGIAPLTLKKNDAGMTAVVFQVPVSRGGKETGSLKFGLVLVGQIQ